MNRMSRQPAAQAASFQMKFPRPKTAVKRNTDPRLNPRPITAEPIEPEGKVALHDVIQAAYNNNKRQQTAIGNLEKAGYQRDNDLSSHNQSVFYNPNSKTLLYSIAGTHNENDLLTDAKLALTGDAKKTARFQEAKDVYAKAKAKYQPENSKIVGHSLGGYIAPHIADKQDLVYTFNKASVGDPNHPNEIAYRTPGDIASFRAAMNKTTYTNGSLFQNPLEAHSSKNLQNKPIFID